MEAGVDTSRMKRAIYQMPADVEQALAERGLTHPYSARPAYQQNDYVGWITRAKRGGTRQKRLNQMLDELETGGVYMGMKMGRRQQAPVGRLRPADDKMSSSGPAPRRPGAAARGSAPSSPNSTTARLGSFLLLAGQELNAKR